MTNNQTVLSWLEEMKKLVNPDQVVWIDGSEEQLEALRAESVRTGEMIKLNEEKLPGCYLHRTRQNDVARVEDRTFICSRKEENAGPTNHWCEPQEMYKKLYDIARGSYHGRTMYIIPFSMIFSPNNLFSEYIDPVLPDLGEESVWQTTFADFASSIFGKEYDVHSYLQSIADGVSPLQEKKGASQFADAVRKACGMFEQNVRFSDLEFARQTIFTGEELAEHFLHNRRSLGYEQSMSRLRNEILHRLEVDKENVRQRVANELVEQYGLASFLSEKDLAVSARGEAIRRTQELEKAFDAKYRPDCFAVYASLLECEFGSDERLAFEERLADHAPVHFFAFTAPRGAVCGWAVADDAGVSAAAVL